MFGEQTFAQLRTGLTALPLGHTGSRFTAVSVERYLRGAGIAQWLASVVLQGYLLLVGQLTLDRAFYRDCCRKHSQVSQLAERLLSAPLILFLRRREHGLQVSARDERKGGTCSTGELGLLHGYAVARACSPSRPYSSVAVKLKFRAGFN